MGVQINEIQIKCSYFKPVRVLIGPFKISAP